MLSVVIPAHNEGKIINTTMQTVDEVLTQAGIDYEMIFIDDNSTDRTWEIVVEKSKEDKRIRGGSLSRHFGKEAAIRAGLAMSRGDCTLIMDCDMQMPPQCIPEMYRLWEQGYEIIAGTKNSRGKERASYGLLSRIFYRIMSKALHIDMMKASDFRLLDKKAVLVLRNIHEQNVFFRAISSWVGFKTIEVGFDVAERAEGKSKWTKWMLIKYAINNITSYTMTPLYIILFLGMIMFIVALVFGVEALISYFTHQALSGFTTVILLQLFIGSITMLSLGLIGYYLARVFDEVRGRPTFILRETTDEKEEIIYD